MVDKTKIKDIEARIYDLTKAFDELEGVDYKIVIEAYDENDDFMMREEESNNWERSWC
jgi:hypothetical protein